MQQLTQESTMGQALSWVLDLTSQTKSVLATVEVAV